ncbi:MAG: PAS domain S-box protein [Marinilabiliaceae bacterium]|nr:PAS domain S-box protein [Marinilabiliaceae bacterium]
MTTEKDPQLNRLEAENRRLKRVMKRMYQGVWGITPHEPESTDSFKPGYLPLYVSSILISNQAFSTKINHVLKTLGEFADVSRIYIFENFDDNKRFRNTFEWCNEGVDAQIENLQDFAYTDFPAWQNMLISEGQIKAANIFIELPQEVCQTLAAQEIQAILVYPLLVKGHFYGFIGFDECSFNREWLPHETDLLQITAHLIANAFEDEVSQQKLNNQIDNQQLLLETARLFTSGLDFQEQIKTALQRLAAHFDVSRAFLFENIDDDRLCKNTFEYCKPEINSVQDQLQKVNYELDLPGWKEAFIKDKFISSDHLTLSDSKTCIFKQKIGTCSLMAIPIQSDDHFWGFIGFDHCATDYAWDVSHKKALSIAAEILAGSFERQSANREIRQKHAEILKINKTLSSKEQFLQNILHTAPIGIVLINNRIIEYANQSVLDISEYSYEELMGSHVSSIYGTDNEDLTGIEKFYSEIQSKGISTIEVKMLSKSKQPILFRIIGTPAPHVANKDSFLLIGEDITQIKRAEHNLRESEERYRKIIESSVDGIFILKSAASISFANSAACNLLGYNPEHLSQQSLQELLPGIRYFDRFRKAIQKIDQGSDFMGDIQVINKNKEIIHTEAYGTRIVLDGENHYYFSLHDITHRKRNEAALKQSEKKFRALTENSTDHIIRINRTSTVSFCNAAFLKDYELDLENCLGKHLKDISGLPSELVIGLSNAIPDILDTESISPLSLEIIHKGSVLAFDWTITPETDDHHQLTSILLVGRNFTRRKKAEQELVVAKEKAVSADRLKSAFLANMSHEIRTPLNAIVGFSNLLKEDTISEVEKGEYINIINNSSENLMELINDIVDLAKIESGELVLHEEELNPNALLEDLYQLFIKKIPLANKNHLKFYLNLPDNSSDILINCDISRLRQVFINMLYNAFKFTQKGFIELGFAVNGEGIRFYVRDTGIGIESQKHEIIFNPFRQEEESTAKKYGGTGLGLSICKRLIHAMGGTIGVISEKETGSEFHFTLPFVSSTPTKIELPVEKVQPPASITPIHYSWEDKLFLLVDATGTTQLQLRKLMEPTRAMLLSARTVASGRELLLKRTDLDLALIDIDLPGIDTHALIQSLRQQNVTTPIIALSADLSEEEKTDLLMSGYTGIVFKPIEKEMLLERINNAFAELATSLASV